MSKTSLFLHIVQIYASVITCIQTPHVAIVWTEMTRNSFVLYCLLNLLYCTVLYLTKF